MKRDIVVGVGITLALILLCEGGARLWWIHWQRSGATTYEENFGWHYPKGFYKGESKYLGISGQVNSMGYRGSEWPLIKPEGKIRVMALGDSVVLGLNDFRVDGGWPRRLELLNPRLEVLNAGVAANTSEQCLWRYKNQLRAFHPDILLVSVGLNDMVELNPKENPTRVKGHWSRKLAQRSYFARAIFGVLYKIIVPAMARDMNTSEELYKSLADWRPIQYENNLKEIIELAKEDHTQVILLTLPTQLNSPDFKDEDYQPKDFLYSQNVSVYRVLIQVYNSSIKGMYFIINMDKHLKDMDDFNDYFHLSEKGNDRYAEIINNVL